MKDKIEELYQELIKEKKERTGLDADKDGWNNDDAIFSKKELKQFGSLCFQETLAEELKKELE